MARRRRIDGLFRAIGATEALGLTVVGVYDARFNASTTSWADARATNGGPTITLTGSPTLSNGVYTFDGATQYGRASNGRLSEITQDCALVVIGTLPTGSLRYVADLSASTATDAMALFQNTNVFAQAIATSAGSTYAAGVRVLHGRRTGSATAVVGSQLGASAEVTSAPANLAGVTADTLTLAASKAATPANFGDVSLRTVVAIKGAYTSATADIWNAYGALRGATL